MTPLPLSILMVHNDPLVLEELAISLRQRVAIVHTALNGKEGLDCFMKQSVDVIVSDIDLPIMNGIEFLESVRKLNEHIPFILCIELKNQSVMMDNIENVTSLFLIKPINIQKLFLKLNRVAYIKSIEERIFVSNDLLEQYKSVVDHSSIVSKADIHGNITYVNDMFCKISGYTKDELLGQPHSIVRDPKMPSSMYRDMWATIQSKKVWQGTIHNCTKSGDRYTVKTTITPILDKNGNIIEYIGLREDITELVKAKNEAREAAKAKGKFLASMSHEIRTPMNAILGFTSLLLERGALDEEANRYVNVINDSAQMLMNVINDILDYSKLESGKFTLSYTTIQPFSEFQKTIQLFSAQMLKKNITFKSKMDTIMGISISIDFLRIQQVITNLLSNAIKFTPEHGEILFYAYLNTNQNNDKSMRIGVKDTGIGIEKEMLDNIFDPFIQADASITRRFGGTGLGLSISSQLLSMMGSKLYVESEEGIGSDFYFELPVNIVETIEVIEKVPVVIKKTQLIGKVLVAEDNELNQYLLKERLRQFNLEPVITSNGQEALDELEHQSYDIILMDIEMPIMGGIDTLLSIKAKEIKTPVIALTANAMDSDKKRYLDLGFDDYLSKPIDMSQLEKILVHYLK